MAGITATSRVITTIQKNAPIESPRISPLSQTILNSRLYIFTKILYRIIVGIRKMLEIIIPNITLRELFKGDSRF